MWSDRMRLVNARGQSTVTGVPMHNRRNEIIPNGCNLGHSGPHSNAPHVGGSCKRCSFSNIRVVIGGSAAREGELQPHWELPRDTMVRNIVFISNV